MAYNIDWQAKYENVNTTLEMIEDRNKDLAYENDELEHSLKNAREYYEQLEASFEGLEIALSQYEAKMHDDAWHHLKLALLAIEEHHDMARTTNVKNLVSHYTKYQRQCDALYETD